MSIENHDNMEDVLDKVADAFEAKMKALFDKDPSLFEGRSSKMSWLSQTSLAAESLRLWLDEVIGKVETQLHSGEFHWDLEA